MKHISVYLFCVLALLLPACRGHQAGSLALDGDCLVDSIVFDDTYAGDIDLATRTISIVVPDGYNADDMCLTALSLSAGATADLAVGDRLCLREARNLRVTNGDVCLDWTLRVVYRRAEITSFVINKTFVGAINQTARTITVHITAEADIRALTPAVVVSDGAVVSPASGQTQDFTHPVSYTVTNGSLSNTYLVTVSQLTKPQALFVGLASSVNGLTAEERTACEWMLSNVPNTMYASFADLRNDAIDLSECRLIWWHYHKDGGVDGQAAFESNAPEAVSAVPAVQQFIDNGGSLLLTRYAAYLPAYLAINGNEPTYRMPNNCWGGEEANAETTTQPWNFFTDHADHPIYADLIMGTDPTYIYTCDAGYRITNSTAQWHIGSDWGGYATVEEFETLTHARAIGHGGDGAVVVWEFPRADKGGILCIGSGCYDWYSVGEVYSGYYANMGRLTLNAINYLTR